jgi:hypothetical protein
MPINLNSASERELTQLPRIGANRARRIVRYRTMRRPFRDWADFAITLGMTERDVEAIRAWAWIGPPNEAIHASRAARRATRGPVAVRRPRRSI